MFKLTPFASLSAYAIMGLLATIITVSFALQQPYLGLSLASPAPGGAMLASATDGPSKALAAGASVSHIGNIRLTASDFVEEPDMLASYDEYRSFLVRQGRLFAELSRPALRIEAQLDAQPIVMMLKPLPARPLSSLPIVFWVQIATALVSGLVGAWVWSLRRTEPSAQLLATAGTGMLLMVLPAAIYSTREIAMDPAIFRWLAAIDHFGALMLGATLVTLFFVYPRRIMPRAALPVLPAIVLVWWLADTLAWGFERPLTGFHLPVLLLLIIFVPAVMVQSRRARGDPEAMAALRWLAMSVFIGTGSFVAAVIAPNFLGRSAPVPQGYAFAFLGIVFLGIAVGVARYRLFALEDRAFDFLFYFGAVALLLMLDAALMTFIAFEQIRAFSVSLIVVALLYLPARNRVAAWLARRRDVDRGDLFNQLVDIALIRDPLLQHASWQTLVMNVFQPLSLQRHHESGPTEPEIRADGLSLAMPSPGGGHLLLHNAYSGRKLFSPRDLRLAGEMVRIVAHTADRRDAREQGAAEERSRVMRDMHDNIGAQLLSALHSRSDTRKDAIIRDALSDLRTLINNENGGAQALDEAAAELRMETAERLEDSGIALDWQSEGTQDFTIDASALHAVRSVLREAISNTIRHSGASRMAISLRVEGSNIGIAISDNGRLNADAAQDQANPGGNGLSNMRARLESLGGSLLTTHDGAMRIDARIPRAGAAAP